MLMGKCYTFRALQQVYDYLVSYGLQSALKALDE